jgi:hypothetical protein
LPVQAGGVPPYKILAANPKRIGLGFFNDGAADAQITFDGTPDSAKFWPVKAGAFFSPDVSAGDTHTGEVFAWAKSAGADLYVLELERVSPFEKGQV